MFEQRTYWKLASLAAVVAIVVAACGAAATPTPAATSAAPTETAAPTATPPPYAGKTVEAGCDYGGEFKTIKAVDQFTVEFDLCYPDPAFLSKIAFSSNPINDSAFLEKTGGAGAQSDLKNQANGTGPYMVKEWKAGDHITFEANPNYWGEKAKMKTLIFRWSDESAARLTELRAGTVDGIDNPGPDDFDVIKADSSLALYPREGLNVFYLGMNNTYKPFDDIRVRQAIAMGIDRQRIIDTFYPKGSTVADYFTPCTILGGCEGPAWYKFDKDAAKKLLADAGFPNGFTTVLEYRNRVRVYLPTPPQIAQELASQLKTNLNITATIREVESATFLDNATAGKLTGLHMLGWGADYPDQTDFLDYHFGAGASKQFGNKFIDLTTQLRIAAALTDPAQRKALYADANALVKKYVPMVPIAHGNSATAFKANVQGAYAAPLTDEKFAVMNIAAQDTLTFMQNGEPHSLYCPDETDGETLRACEQVQEGLYTYKTGGVDAIPALAEKCTPDDQLKVWTCNLRQGVKFHDGAELDANDVVDSFNAQLDYKSPLHKGRTGAFDYFSALFGAFLNAPKS